MRPTVLDKSPGLFDPQQILNIPGDIKFYRGEREDAYARFLGGIRQSPLQREPSIIESQFKEQHILDPVTWTQKFQESRILKGLWDIAASEGESVSDRRQIDLLTMAFLTVGEHFFDQHATIPPENIINISRGKYTYKEAYESYPGEDVICNYTYDGYIPPGKERPGSIAIAYRVFFKQGDSSFQEGPLRDPNGTICAIPSVFFKLKRPIFYLNNQLGQAHKAILVPKLITPVDFQDLHSAHPIRPYGLEGLILIR